MRSNLDDLYMKLTRFEKSSAYTDTTVGDRVWFDQRTIVNDE